MSAELDYAIVVPSRHRTANMATIRALLPSAIICVDEREKDDYAPLVPADKLLLHPPLDGYALVVNWIMDAVKAPILIICDDDTRGVECRTGFKRYITDPEEVLAILENAAQCCQDLGLTAFAFSRTINTAMIQPDFEPVRPIAYLSNVFGVMGAARHRKMDPQFAGRNAIDITLETLLHDRCMYGEVRFYFDCGQIFSSKGGNVDLINAQVWGETTRRLVNKWGKAMTLKPPNFVKSKAVDVMRITVSRKNKLAQK